MVSLKHVLAFVAANILLVNGTDIDENAVADTIGKFFRADFFR